jgi:hypothetical protein
MRIGSAAMKKTESCTTKGGTCEQERAEDEDFEM